MANVVEEHFLARPTTSKVGTEQKLELNKGDSKVYLLDIDCE